MTELVETAVIVVSIFAAVMVVVYSGFTAIEWIESRHAYNAIFFGLKKDTPVDIKKWKTVESSSATLRHPEVMTFTYKNIPVVIEGIIAMSYPTVSFTRVKVENYVKIEGNIISTIGKSAILQIDPENLGIHLLKRMVVKKIRKSIKDMMAMENL